MNAFLFFLGVLFLEVLFLFLVLGMGRIFMLHKFLGALFEILF
jgi:hypothetical protein